MRMSPMSDEQRPNANEAELNDTPESEDPIGDVTDGEAETSTSGETEVEIGTAEGEAEDQADAATEAEDEAENDAQAEAGADEDEAEPEFKRKARPPVKLERLQKILAQAGVASRRKAE